MLFGSGSFKDWKRNVPELKVLPIDILVSQGITILMSDPK